MFNLVGKIPERYLIAVSGGMDSMSCLHWLFASDRQNRLQGVVHINHNTGKYANNAEELVSQYCTGRDIPLYTTRLTGVMPKWMSKEAWWRMNRYAYFTEIANITHAPIIVCHHLGDCIEEYVMNTMVRGYADTIRYWNGVAIRPFLRWSKADISQYADTNAIPYLEDPSNNDVVHKRNLIRKVILPHIYELNPGINKIVDKLIVNNGLKTVHGVEFDYAVFN